MGTTLLASNEYRCSVLRGAGNPRFTTLHPVIFLDSKVFQPDELRESSWKGLTHQDDMKVSEIVEVGGSPQAIIIGTQL